MFKTISGGGKVVGATGLYSGGPQFESTFFLFFLYNGKMPIILSPKRGTHTLRNSMLIDQKFTESESYILETRYM